MSNVAEKIWVWCDGQSRSSGYWDNWGGPVNGVPYLLKTTADAEREADSKTIAALEAVAFVAAQCTIDLGYNLGETDKEHMSGKIANGAFLHVLARYDNLFAALQKAGYTEKHPIFGFPIKPQPADNAPRIAEAQEKSQC